MTMHLEILEKILEFCDLNKNPGRMVDLKSSTFLLSVQWLKQLPFCFTDRPER